MHLVPDILLYSLEDRRQLINEYYKAMEKLSPRLSRYVEDVQYAMETGMNSSVVSHLTYNLILAISKATNMLNTYEYIRSKYILDEEYDKEYDIWKDFLDKSDEIKKLINNIEDDYFDDDIDFLKFINDIIPPNLSNVEGLDLDESNCDMERIDLDPSQIIGYVEMASSVGAGLLKCLRQQMNNTECWLSNIKNAIYTDEEEGLNYDFIYKLNYNLYKKEYWPKDGQSFRNSVKELNHNKELTIEKLEQISYDERKNFYNSDTGRLWRDFSPNKKDLYFEAKRIGINEEQWRYMFKQICRFEAYDEWVEELRNPPESDEDKQKREKLLKANKVFNLEPSNSKHKVDILRLYYFIRDRFIAEKIFVYEWYALYYILRRVGVLTNCTTEDFVKQMNDEEWFAYIEKKCSANEINTYSFLNEKSPDVWDVMYKPTGNRASNKSVDNLKRKYTELEDNIDEIYVRE